MTEIAKPVPEIAAKRELAMRQKVQNESWKAGQSNKSHPEPSYFLEGILHDLTLARVPDLSGISWLSASKIRTIKTYLQALCG